MTSAATRVGRSRSPRKRTAPSVAKSGVVKAMAVKTESGSIETAKKAEVIAASFRTARETWAGQRPRPARLRSAADISGDGGGLVRVHAGGGENAGEALAQARGVDADHATTLRRPLASMKARGRPLTDLTSEEEAMLAALVARAEAAPAVRPTAAVGACAA